MNRFPTLLIALASATAAIGVGASSPAAAAGDPEIGMEVLDALCEEHGGTAYFTPWAISRCERAKAKHGTAIEQQICEGLLEGNFASVPSPGRRNRINWQCFPG